MFYSGDIQSGINLALQQNKLVVCFVRGEYNSMVTFNPFGPDLIQTEMTKASSGKNNGLGITT